MNLTDIKSYNELLTSIKDKSKAYVLLYKKGSEISKCAIANISDALESEENITVLTADVTSVRDIHTNYNISSVPSLLEFDNGEFIKVIKCCNDKTYYKTLFENAVFANKSGEKGKTKKRVTVYSTPTCSWCNTLKTYLRKNNIRFRDVDVSKDQNAAQRMAQKSGQQGVPQTDINGRIIVGFDRTKINELLEIKE